MIPSGGVHAVVVVVWVVVLGLTVINAGRGELGLAISGGILATGLSVVLAKLRRPPKVREGEALEWVGAGVGAVGVLVAVLALRRSAESNRIARAASRAAVDANTLAERSMRLNSGVSNSYAGSSGSGSPATWSARRRRASDCAPGRRRRRS